MRGNLVMVVVVIRDKIMMVVVVVKQFSSRQFLKKYMKYHFLFLVTRPFNYINSLQVTVYYWLSVDISSAGYVGFQLLPLARSNLTADNLKFGL